MKVEIVNTGIKPVVIGRNKLGQPIVIQAGKKDLVQKETAAYLVNQFSCLKMTEKKKGNK